MPLDPYLDKDTGILRNLLDIADKSVFDTVEAQLVFANELELPSAKIPRTNNLSEILAIHEHLFNGIFEWAGKVRTVDIKKNSESAEFFLIRSKITQASEYVFEELKKDNFLKGLTFDRFVVCLAHYYDQLNYIHPFREGNGRVQRIFWSRVAEDAGYEINWSAIVGDENDEASRLGAEKMDTSALESMFARIVTRLE